MSSRSGLAFPLVMAITLVASVELASLGLYATSHLRQVRRNETHMKSFYMAEAAAQKAMGQIRLHINTLATVPDQAALDVMAANPVGTAGNYVINNFAIDSGALTSGTLDEGDYEGLRADTQSITVTAEVQGANASDPPVRVEQEIQIQQIPVFQFGVFYDNDLEILPGATMTFAGPVHTNQDMYVGTSATLTFDSGITAAGAVYQGRKDSTQVMSGSIFIQDGDGADQDMKNDDGTWLDSLHADWLGDSQTRWDENVKSDVHNTRQLTLPLPVSEDLSDIIKRRASDDTDAEESEKLDYKAQVRLIDGQVKDQNGTALNFNYCSTGGALATCAAANVVKPIVFPSQTFSGTCNSSSHFKDNRESRCIKATEVYIDKLNASPKYLELKAANPTGLVFYHSDLRNSSSGTYRDALRISNGTQFLANTTFASQNPVYVKGNFNSTNKKNIGIIGDAMNIQSTGWSDANSTSTLSSRTASATTVNAAVIAGNTETTVGHYNGGFENIHRFLENWSGKTLTFSGSVAVLYNSTIATGSWGQSNVYNPPNRTWGYDQALSQATANVPGFPSVINLTKGEWDQQDPTGSSGY